MSLVYRPIRFSGFVAILLIVLLGTGCTAIVSSTTSRFADSLSVGIVNQDDPQTVADGAPAYLILVDGLIQDYPDDVPVLLAGARLYGVYGSIFVDDRKRMLHMTDKAFRYSVRALCKQKPATCGIHKLPYPEFELRLKQVGAGNIDVLYTYATSWAGWIQPRSKDWNAVADLAKVKAVINQVLALDETYDQGGAHFYLGVLDSLLPPAMGGKPETARKHFERAIELSGGKNLMVKVYFAERYARMKFDRALHDRLLNEVVNADAEAKGYTLSNTLAQQKAHKLLNTADEYF
jgi:hypothetical protein